MLLQTAHLTVQGQCVQVFHGLRQSRALKLACLSHAVSDQGAENLRNWVVQEKPKVFVIMSSFPLLQPERSWDFFLIDFLQRFFVRNVLLDSMKLLLNNVVNLVFEDLARSLNHVIFQMFGIVKRSRSFQRKEELVGHETQVKGLLAWRSFNVRKHLLTYDLQSVIDIGHLKILNYVAQVQFLFLSSF